MESIRPALATLRLSAPRPAYRPLYQCLHTSAARCATPLPHPSVPGPPPETPSPAATDALERVARKKRQASMLKQAQEARVSSKTTTVLKKRFWKDVTVKETEEGLQVFLDQRPVRTPDKQVLTLPTSKPLLATAIALEWDLLMSAQQALKTHYIPMTSIAARALDIQAADAKGNERVRGAIIDMLLDYLATDTMLCWAPAVVMNETLRNGKTLRNLQEEAATKLIAYLTTHVWPGVQITPTLDDSIVPVSQPEMTTKVIHGWCVGLPAFELAGLERAVLASKSLLVGVRLIYEWGEAFAHTRKPSSGRRFGIEEAAEASTLEVRWQTGQWGEVEDTHDVEKEDLRRQLGNAIILVGGKSS